MTFHYSSYERYWTTLEGERIKIADLKDSHLENIINMLARNGKEIPTAIQEEHLNRSMKQLLRSQPAEVALWILSNNPKMRKFAESIRKVNEATS